ncbi:MAG: pyridoxamine 5'-phosphate oxidase family protein, partial [Coleofasciculaceae cyanobacterium]
MTWRSLLARAIHHNRSLPYSRYFQLATIRADHRPANRTVVFRGFLDETDQLKMITDFRSAKVEQIQQQVWGEACWYFPKTREQFRLSGKLTL